MDGPKEYLVTRLSPAQAASLTAVSPRKHPGLPTVDHSCLTEAPPGSPFAVEWNYYRRIVAQLLADGHEGDWMLIDHDQVIGIWKTEAEANAIRLQQYLRKPVLMKQVLSQEPVLKIGYNRLCPP